METFIVVVRRQSGRPTSTPTSASSLPALLSAISPTL